MSWCISQGLPYTCHTVDTCCCEFAVKGVVFKQIRLGWHIKIIEFGSRIGYHFQGENFSLEQGNWELTLKNMKVTNLNLLTTQFDCKEIVNLSSFWEIVTLG